MSAAVMNSDFPEHLFISLMFDYSAVGQWQWKSSCLGTQVLSVWWFCHPSETFPMVSTSGQEVSEERILRIMWETLGFRLPASGQLHSLAPLNSKGLGNVV